VAGEKARHSLDTWNYDEARELLVAREAEIKNPSPKTEPLSVEEAVTRFTNELTASNRAHRTVRRYRYSLERLTEFLGSVGVNQIADAKADHLAA
jgi:hypothetical protein